MNESGLGRARRGEAGQGKVLQITNQITTRLGEARHGPAWHVAAWQGKVFHKLQITKRGEARRGLSWPVASRRGKARYYLTGGSRMRTMKVAEVVLDFDLYPRNNVDSHNVRTICDAIESGAELPPIVICRKSKRVADGFHRVRAVLKVHGDGAEIDVIEKTYKTDADLFLDAMRYNASHGCKLDPCDRTHCLIIADRLGIPIDAMAGALHVTADRLGALKADRTAISGGLSIPLKRTIRHKAGQKLNKRQREANDRLSGMNQVFYVNQVVELIEADLLDLSDENLMGRLTHLQGLLAGVLVAS